MRLRRYAVTTLSDIQCQRSRVVRLGDEEIAVFRLSDGTVRAIENRCPHKGGKLSEGIVCGRYVFCPLHDWKIGLDDGRVQPPDEGCVRTYPVEVDEKTGTVYLLVSERSAMIS